jgi:hypothetical protein
MVRELKPVAKNLYDTDYNLWILETAAKLQAKDFESIDLENLVEEVLDLSKRDKRKLESLLTRLFEHLLKLKYWESEREKNQGHWQREITNFRLQITRQLEDSPSLKSHLKNKFVKCYQDGCQLASKAMQLSLNTFPSSPIGNVEQILDENWFPC